VCTGIVRENGKRKEGYTVWYREKRKIENWTGKRKDREGMKKGGRREKRGKIRKGWVTGATERRERVHGEEGRCGKEKGNIFEKRKYLREKCLRGMFEKASWLL
jgi:hypothetical protein